MTRETFTQAKANECIHTRETGRHEPLGLHWVHQANAPFWYPQCPTCGWIDLELMMKEAGLVLMKDAKPSPSTVNEMRHGPLKCDQCGCDPYRDFSDWNRAWVEGDTCPRHYLDDDSCDGRLVLAVGKPDAKGAPSASVTPAAKQAVLITGKTCPTCDGDLNRIGVCLRCTLKQPAPSDGNYILDYLRD
jgi:hypothetical protein